MNLNDNNNRNQALLARAAAVVNHLHIHHHNISAAHSNSTRSAPLPQMTPGELQTLHPAPACPLLAANREPRTTLHRPHLESFPCRLPAIVDGTLAAREVLLIFCRRSRF